MDGSESRIELINAVMEHQNQDTQTNGFIFNPIPNCCIICNKSSKNLIQLGCTHTFCTECIQRLCQSQFQNESNTYLQCPICQFQFN